MSKPFVFEKPLGMRDVLPELVKQKQHVLFTIQDVFERWGYAPIETPTLEYFDTVGGVSPTIEKKMFKLLDRSGRTLVLRPDFTAPIARVVSSILKEAPFPIRLSYQGPVYRAQEKEAGRNAEFPEVGIELIGEEAPDADAEVIALASEALQAVRIPSFKLAIGHVGLLNALFAEVTDEHQASELRTYLHQKDYVGYRSVVEKGPFTDGEKTLLLSVLEWRGDMTQLQQAKKLASGEKVQQAFCDLEELWTCLKLYGASSHLLFDLSLVSHRAYYTGVFFEIYASGLGFPLGSGGRYDHLVGQFGRPAPATGFTLKVDRIIEISQLPLPEQPRQVLITYTAQEREQAVDMARQRRQKGEHVTLHRLPTAEAEPKEANGRFDEWVRLEQGGGPGEPSL
ncbi:ATP phosphoribosyltransferase regulatory subunit [Caldalkalibacillus uzonensis]|uniref:ATP phosphoribosyltransferase regulatory subunit n=1 Tax=Caldalkalibacillus uzonensis TaxID=353224 RepID=A0ABU0CWR0_9BACI|nr:ATP phosphoribosyltransferase regulatory subunit [Caldalkalibacillus uzonensis]MDQ0340856.1 ATP phosphoribosyltransferase regulatory subunit [Caldalkalibacillus uzonensis]